MTKVPIAVKSDLDETEPEPELAAAEGSAEQDPPAGPGTGTAGSQTGAVATAAPHAEAEDAEAEDAEAEDARESGPAPAPEAAVGDASGAEAAERQAVRQERDKLKEQLLRTTADFDNFRKRTRRELEEAKMRGKDAAVCDLLPVFDNLERAVQASENATEVASVLEGVRMVLKLFDDTAQRMGLNRVGGVGSRFDPAVHEAIQQVETDAHPPGTIVTEVAAGYMFGQRLIRPGMVVVAKAPRPAPEPEGTPEAPGSAAPDAAAAGDDPAAEGSGTPDGETTTDAAGDAPEEKT